MRKKHLMYNNQTSLQQVMQSKLNIKHFTCDKLTDTFEIYMYGFEHMNQLGN